MASKLDALKAKHADNMLTPEQMENIAGGKNLDTWSDTFFLNALFGSDVCPTCDNYDVDNEPHKWNSIVTKAWKSAGVDYHIQDRYNSYSIDGKAVSRDAARKHAMQVVGKNLRENSNGRWEPV